MRLLNDKCSDRKSLVLSLSRAVSRSRIIIVTAPLFSEENITGIVAKAIGATTEIVDNEKCGINSDAEIKVIKGSVPLVTKDGVYGGCLIQSGPQTLVLLTDTKAIRKTIMQDLIHPYIKDLSVEEVKNSIVKPEQVDKNEVITDDVEIVEEEIIEEEIDDIADQIITEDDGDETEYVFADATELVIDEEETADNELEEYKDDIKGLYIEPETDKNTHDDEDYNDYYAPEPEVPTSPFNIWFLIISIILLITVAVLCYCIFYVPTKAGIEPSVYLQEIFNTMFS